MVLKNLSPKALSAAMRGGTSSWGEWGGADHHIRYIEQIKLPDRRRRMCHCGCRKRVTYRGFANGVALASGCELSMMRWEKTGQ